jgi:hypothetical protein
MFEIGLVFNHGFLEIKHKTVALANVQPFSTKKNICTKFQNTVLIN